MMDTTRLSPKISYKHVESSVSETVVVAVDMTVHSHPLRSLELSPSQRKKSDLLLVKSARQMPRANGRRLSDVIAVDMTLYRNPVDEVTTSPATSPKVTCKLSVPDETVCEWPQCGVTLTGGRHRLCTSHLMETYFIAWRRILQRHAIRQNLVEIKRGPTARDT